MQVWPPVLMWSNSNSTHDTRYEFLHACARAWRWSHTKGLIGHSPFARNIQSDHASETNNHEHAHNKTQTILKCIRTQTDKNRHCPPIDTSRKHKPQLKQMQPVRLYVIDYIKQNLNHSKHKQNEHTCHPNTQSKTIHKHVVRKHILTLWWKIPEGRAKGALAPGSPPGWPKPVLQQISGSASSVVVSF